MNKILSSILALILILCVTACSYKDGERRNVYYMTHEDKITDNEDNFSKSDSLSVMDLFDGNRKIWFFISKANVVRYDTEVSMVIVTHNKTVEKAYYKIPSNQTHINAQPKIYGNRFTLNDFSGLSDEEILDLIDLNYADVSETYEYSIGSQKYYIKGQEMPHNITYNGYLNNSGNYLEREEILLLDTEIYPLDCPASLLVNNFINPITIKEKEYVGVISTALDRGLITVNCFKTFEVGYDSPDGAAETY